MNFPLIPVNASTVATDVDALMITTLIITVFFSTLIAAAILYFAVKYRATDRKVNREGAPDSHLMLELVWSGIPLIIVMGLFLWGAKVFYHMRTIPADATEITVVGKQWMWKIQHPEGQREINALHIPVNKPIALRMISEDVIHDFAIPAFRVKQDVIPGRYSRMWFEATKTGQYHLFCDQYCGTLHSRMVGTVTVLSAEDYTKWLGKGPFPAETAAGGGPLTLGNTGEELFTRMGCASCHHATGDGRGPSLVGLYGSKVPLQTGDSVTADENYIRESILHPSIQLVAGYQPIMPSFQNQMTEENVLELIQYIKSLKGSTHDVVTKER
jgi:cytochrome c oxidase subunit 2